MIHFLTPIHGSAPWPSIQRSYVYVYTHPYKLHCTLSNVPEDIDITGYNVIDSCDQEDANGNTVVERINHYENVAKLIRYAVSSGEIEDDDYVCIIDSDCFPINNFDPSVIGDNILTIDRSKELTGHNPPKFNYIFLCMKKSVMKDHFDASWTDRAAVKFQASLPLEKLKTLERTESIVRGKSIMFGVYGDLIYHHGCGSRVPFHWQEDGPNRTEEKISKNMSLSERIMAKLNYMMI